MSAEIKEIVQIVFDNRRTIRNLETLVKEKMWQKINKIDIAIQLFDQKLNDIKADTEEIKKEKKLTNGRIGKNEIRIAAIFAVGSVITVVILPVIFYFLFR